MSWTTEQERLIGAARRLMDDGRAASTRSLEDEGIGADEVAAAFGTVRGLRIAAGATPRPQAGRLAAAVARHEAVLPAVAEIEAQRDALANREKASPARGRHASALVCADVHDVHVDPFWLRLWLEAVERSRGFVDTIVLNGDIWDAYEFSNYAKRPDTVAKAEARWRFVRWFVAETRRRNPDARIVWVEGNHECVAADTEVLCRDGWKRADEVMPGDELAQMRLGDGRMVFGMPLAIASREADLVALTGDQHDELVSDNHHVVLDGERVRVDGLIGQKIRQDRFSYAARQEKPGIAIDDDWIRLLAWVITDGCIVRRQITNRRVQFKLSRPEKIDALKGLLERMGIEHKVTAATMSPTNKLQPYLIKIYGDVAREIDARLGETKAYPAEWLEMSERQARVLIETLLLTDGHRHFNHVILSTARRDHADAVQQIMIRNGIPTKITSKIQGGGFARGKEILRVAILDNGSHDRRYVEVRRAGRGRVIAIQTTEQTLVTRRGGKAVVTGNCRLLRWFAESAGSSLPLLQAINGWGRLDSILGVSENDLTYVSRASLKAETRAAAQREVRDRNWWVWEDAVVFCHYPPARRSLTRDYVSGHHHAWKVETYSCHVRGSIKWLQLGCGCLPKADYCDAERLWDEGFAFVHLDRELAGRQGAVQLEYVHVGNGRARLMGEAYTAGGGEAALLAPFLA